MGGDEKEPILHQDLRRGQINPKLRIGFHAGHFSSVTAARFFNLVRPPIIIIETGQSAYTRVYTVYTCIHARVYTCYTYIVGVWAGQSRSNPSHSVTSAGQPGAHLHTEIGLYTHLHTHRLELYIWPPRDLPRENWPPHAMQWPALHTYKRESCNVFSLLVWYNHLVAISAKGSSSMKYKWVLPSFT